MNQPLSLDVDSLYKQAYELFEKHQYAESEDLCFQILDRKKDHLLSANLLALIRFHHGQFDDTLAILNAICQANNENPEVHNTIGETYRITGQIEKAIPHFEKALQLNPDYHHALNNLGVTLNNIDQDKAVAVLTDLFHRKRGVPLNQSPHAPTPNFSLEKPVGSVVKLRHDIEQLEYLLARNLLPTSFEHTLENYRHLLTNLPTPASDHACFYLSPEQYEPIRAFYNRAVYVADGSRLAGAAVNPDLDIKSITQRYVSNRPGMTHIDDFLTTEALNKLRRFCLESTIWYGFQRGPYLGAYLNDGLCCGLLFQIAEEMRQAMPKIFKHHRLNQIWAYKYEPDQRGIAIHADEAAVNINFWITPTEANLSPATGGLVVWKEEAPLEWDFNKYNNDAGAIDDFLRRTKSPSENVPHRQNRMVLFNSNLFHRTGDIHFKPGYENRRINVTMLFGSRYI